MNKHKLKSGLPVYAGVLANARDSLRKMIGVVDRVEREGYIMLKKEGFRDGKPHWIPLSWVEETDGNGVYLSKLEPEVRGGMFDSLPSKAA